MSQTISKIVVTGEFSSSSNDDGLGLLEAGTMEPVATIVLELDALVRNCDELLTAAIFKKKKCM